METRSHDVCSECTTEALKLIKSRGSVCHVINRFLMAVLLKTDLMAYRFVATISIPKPSTHYWETIAEIKMFFNTVTLSQHFGASRDYFHSLVHGNDVRTSKFQRYRKMRYDIKIDLLLYGMFSSAHDDGILLKRCNPFLYPVSRILAKVISDCNVLSQSFPLQRL